MQENDEGGAYGVLLNSQFDGAKAKMRNASVKLIREAIANSSFSETKYLKLELGMIEPVIPKQEYAIDFSHSLVYLEAVDPDETKEGLQTKIRASSDFLRTNVRQARKAAAASTSPKARQQIEPKSTSPGPKTLLPQGSDESDGSQDGHVKAAIKVHHDGAARTGPQWREVEPPTTSKKQKQLLLKLLRERKLQLGTSKDGREIIHPIEEPKPTRSWQEQQFVSNRLSRPSSASSSAAALFLANAASSSTAPVPAIRHLLSDPPFQNPNRNSRQPGILSDPSFQNPQGSSSFGRGTPDDGLIEDVVSELSDDDAIPFAPENFMRSRYIDGREEEALAPCVTEGSEEETLQQNCAIEEILWGAYEGHVRVHNPHGAPDRDLLALAIREQIPAHFHQPHAVARENRPIKNVSPLQMLAPGRKRWDTRGDRRKSMRQGLTKKALEMDFGTPIY